MGVDDLLVLIPAHNEAASLPSVLSEVRAARARADILVIDDGSRTARSAWSIGLASGCFAFTSALASAARCAPACATPARLGYSRVVRVDGDGQHRPSDIEALLSRFCAGVADVTFGSRYAQARVGLVRRALAALREGAHG